MFPSDLRPTPMQEKVLAFRRHANIANLGGRGGGKSFCLQLDLLDHIREYGHNAKPLVLRESHAGLQQFADSFYLLSQQAFGPSVTQNKQAGTLSFPNGCTTILSNISDVDSYSKNQGKSLSFLGLDEAGNYPQTTFEYVNLLRSNLRVPKGMRAHVHLTANPHGRSHGIIVKRFLKRAQFWQPYYETDDAKSPIWVNATSTYLDNPHIDQDAYHRNLKASTYGNEGLERAWIDGSWATFKGGMFDVFDPAIHVQAAPKGGARWKYQGAMDFGTSSPSVLLLLGELLDHAGPFRAGDIFVLGELDTCPDDNDLSVGDGSPPSVLADMAKELMSKHRASKKTQWVVDDFRGMHGPNDTLTNILNELDVWSSRPQTKHRAAGWALIRQLFQSVTNANGPGLFITPECPHLIETLQMIPRDDLRPDEIARRCPIDHHADALRMGLDELFNRVTSYSGRTIGGY